MANVLGELFQDIADAIRSKTGSTDTLKPNQFPEAIEGITTGGGTSQDVRYVTFMNGTEVLYKKPVAVGDDCVDVLTKGLISTPTKESTAQYNYGYLGWGATDNGAVDANILKNITEDKTVYAIYSSILRFYTITWLDDDGSELPGQTQWAYNAMPSYTPEKEGYEFNSWEPEITRVTGDATYTAQWTKKVGLDSLTWEEIAEISAAGTGANYFSVGDSKGITISGKVGVQAISGTFYVYIIGFDHNSAVEGSGITFGGFRLASGSSAKDVVLYCPTIDADGRGTKTFNMNHWGNYNYGGWSACDLRYDILGSTDVAPKNYGGYRRSTDTGSNPTANCTTNPVANTLMSCLPANLRAVMKPITKWTNNVGNSSTAESSVTATIDYLPLLSEYETRGAINRSNSYEQNHQQQYAYYADGVFKAKYRHTDENTEQPMWLRSPANNTGSSAPKTYCCYYSSFYSNYAYTNYGLGPIFLV